MNRRTGEIESAPQLVLKISSVTEVHQFGIIDEHDECRRPDTHLGGIEYVEAVSALIGRRGVHADAVHDDFIECTRLYAFLMGVIHHPDQREQGRKTGFGFGREESYGRIIEELELFSDVILKI